MKLRTLGYFVAILLPTNFSKAVPDIWDSRELKNYLSTIGIGAERLHKISEIQKVSGSLECWKKCFDDVENLEIDFREKAVAILYLCAIGVTQLENTDCSDDIVAIVRKHLEIFNPSENYELIREPYEGFYGEISERIRGAGCITAGVILTYSEADLDSGVYTSSDEDGSDSESSLNTDDEGSSDSQTNSISSVNVSGSGSEWSTPSGSIIVKVDDRKFYTRKRAVTL